MSRKQRSSLQLAERAEPVEGSTATGLRQDSILQHQLECKMENKLRLKLVKNLEELVKFKITTVGDKLVQDGTLVHPASVKKSGLNGLRAIVDPLLTSKHFPATSTGKPYSTGSAAGHQASQIGRMGLLSRLDEEDSIMQESSEALIVDESAEASKETIPNLLNIEMTKSGSLIKKERGNINHQIEALLQLDSNDPIRKLQQFYKDGPYGHDYAEDGTRLVKKHKAPKYKNYIMQRYEDKRQRALSRQQVQKRSSSVQQQAQQLSQLKPNVGEPSDDYLNPQKIVDYSSSASLLQLPHRSRSIEQHQQIIIQNESQDSSSQLTNSHRMHRNQFGAQKAYKSLQALQELKNQQQLKQQEHKQLLTANFLGQLKNLQKIVKANIVFDNKSHETEEDELEKLERLGDQMRERAKRADEAYFGNLKREGQEQNASLPRLVKQQESSVSDYGSSIVNVRASTDDKHVSNLAERYMPGFAASSSRQKLVYEDQKAGAVVNDSIGERARALIESEDQLNRIQEQILQAGRQRSSSFQREVLDGVDSDEELLEDLVKRAEEVHLLEIQGTDVNKMMNEQERKRKEMEKIRQLMQMQSSQQQELSFEDLSAEEKAILMQGTVNGGQKMSMLSKFANIQRKDYVVYNENQIKIFQLLNCKNESQKRIAMLQQRRQNNRDKKNNASLNTSQFARKKSRDSSQQAYSFSKKKFMEDLIQSSDKPAIAPASQTKILPKISKKIDQKRGQGGKPNPFSQQTYKSILPDKLHELKQEAVGATQPLSQARAQNNNQDLKQIDDQQVLIPGWSPFKTESEGNNLMTSYVDHLKQKSMTSNAGTFESRMVSQVEDSILYAQNDMFENNYHQLYSNEFQVNITQRNQLLKIENQLPSTHPIQQSLDGSKEQDDESCDTQRRRRESTMDEILRKSQNITDNLFQPSNDNQISMMQDFQGANDSEAIDIDDANFQRNFSTHQVEGSAQVTNGSKERTRIDLNKMEYQNSTESHIQSVQHSDDIFNYQSAAQVQESRQNANESVGETPSSKKAQALVENLSKSHSNIVEKSEPIQDEQRSISPHSNELKACVAADKRHLLGNENNHSSQGTLLNMTGLQAVSIRDDLSKLDIMGSKDDLRLTDEDAARHTTQLLDENSQTPVRFQQKSKDQVPQNIEIRHANLSKKQSQEIGVQVTQISNTNTIDPSKNMITLSQNGSNQSIVRSDKHIKTNHGKAFATKPSLKVNLSDTKGLIIQQDSSSSTRRGRRYIEINSKKLLLEHKVRGQSIIRKAGGNVRGAGGYETANEQVDSKSFAFLNDMAESIFYQKSGKKNGFHAMRFKKFPRFSIYLQSDKNNSFLEKNYISLNNRMLEFLAQDPALFGNEHGHQKQPSESQLDLFDQLGDGVSPDVSPPALVEKEDSIFVNKQTIEVDGSLAFAEIDVETDQTVQAIKSVVHLNNSSEEQHKVSSTQEEETQPYQSMNPQIRKSVDQQTLTVQSMNNTETKIEKNAKVPAQPIIQVQKSGAQNEMMILPAEPLGEELPSMQQLAGMKLNSSVPTSQKSIRSKKYTQQRISTIMDPFEKVLLLKNIDNPILTSFRTLNRTNNVISHTLKVIHNKFSAKQLSQQVKNTYKKARNALYPVSEVESIGDVFSDAEEQYMMLGDVGPEKAPIDNTLRNSHQVPHIEKIIKPLHSQIRDSLISSNIISPKVGLSSVVQSHNQIQSKNQTQVHHHEISSQEPRTLAITSAEGRIARDTEPFDPQSPSVNSEEKKVDQQYSQKKIIKKKTSNVTVMKKGSQESYETELSKVQKVELQRLSQGMLETESEELSQQMIFLNQRFSEANNKHGRQQEGANKSRTKKDGVFLTHQIDPKQQIKGSEPQTTLHSIQTRQLYGTDRDSLDSLERQARDNGSTPKLIDLNEILSLQHYRKTNAEIDSKELKATASNRYGANSSSKADNAATRSNSTCIPQAAGFRNSSRQKEKFKPVQKSASNVVAINNANVDDYLGVYQNYEPSASFKTSKIILQSKPHSRQIINRTQQPQKAPSSQQRNQKQQAPSNAMQDQATATGRSGSSLYQHDRMFGRETNQQTPSQVTQTTLNTMYNSTQNRMLPRRNIATSESRTQSNVSISQQQAGIAKSSAARTGLKGHKPDGKYLQTLAEEAADRTQYQEQLNQIIDQVQAFHGKHRQQIASKKPNQKSVKQRARQLLEQSSNDQDTIILQKSSNANGSQKMEQQAVETKQQSRSGSREKGRQQRESSTDSISYNQILGNTKPRTRDQDKLKAIHRNLENRHIRTHTKHDRERRSNQDLEHTEGRFCTGGPNETRYNQTEEQILKRVETANTASVKIDDSLEVANKLTAKKTGVLSQPKLECVDVKDNTDESNQTGSVAKLVQKSPSLASGLEIESQIRLTTKMLHSNVQLDGTATVMKQTPQEANSKIISKLNYKVSDRRKASQADASQADLMLKNAILIPTDSDRQLEDSPVKKATMRDTLQDSTSEAAQSKIVRQSVIKKSSDLTGGGLIIQNKVSSTERKNQDRESSQFKPKNVEELTKPTGNEAQHSATSIDSGQIIARNSTDQIPSNLIPQSMIDRVKVQSFERTVSQELERQSEGQEEAEEGLGMITRSMALNYQEHEQMNEIAQRIVRPNPGQQMRQMIDSLCMREKNYVYQNPNYRADCVGTQNPIFDLSSSHLANRPRVIQREEREAKQNMEQMLHGEAKFSGNSFLAGQKAPIRAREVTGAAVYRPQLKKSSQGRNTSKKNQQLQTGNFGKPQSYQL